MKRSRERILGKRNLISFLIFPMVIGTFLTNSYGEETKATKWGFSFLGGFNVHSEPDLMLLAFLPRLDLPLHKNWDFEFEGNFSYYAISDSKDLYLLGLNTNLLFKPIQWNKGSLFLFGGAGLAYNNNSDREIRVTKIGDSHVAGLLQIGSGIHYYMGKGWLLRGEYRFKHISDPFQRDDGINTHSLVLGLSFQ